jgi:hypothetical protein
MGRPRPGILRLSGSRFALTVGTDDERVVDLHVDISPHTAATLRHVVAAHLDPESGQRHRRTHRPLLDRVLGAVGASAERLEVHPERPPRFVLVVSTPTGRAVRLDLDLLDAAELIVARRIPVVAIGWPSGDWDAALHRLLEDTTG